MTELSMQILEHYQVRKKKEQKLAFIALLKRRFPELQVEEGGFGHNRNIVIGNIKTAKVLCTAHYDTCAQLPFPNLILPQNILLTLGYNILICIPFLAVMAGLTWLFSLWFSNTSIGLFIAYLCMMGLMYYTLMGGKPNQHTANDNTSGVITLCELLSALTPEERSQTAFVFFDNEENGLLGSSWFASRHKKEGLAEKLVLNFDCVSDGDHMLFVMSKSAQKQYGSALTSAFPQAPEMTPHFAKSGSTMYPSDQGNFKMSVGIAAMRKSRVGLFMDKIHTKRDTVFLEDNIVYLQAGTKRFLASISE